MVPVLVGGGIRTPSEVRSVYESGADLVIVGNAAESNHGLLKEMIRERDRFNI
jgi:putative glycerol-1-phosphate prenyltransferase